MIEEIKSFEERKETLIKKGKEEGYITYEQLASELKGLDLDSDSLDELYNSMIDNNIQIVTEEDLKQSEEPVVDEDVIKKVLKDDSSEDMVYSQNSNIVE